MLSRQSLSLSRTSASILMFMEKEGARAAFFCCCLKQISHSSTHSVINSPIFQRSTSKPNFACPSTYTDVYPSHVLFRQHKVVPRRPRVLQLHPPSGQRHQEVLRVGRARRRRECAEERTSVSGNLIMGGDKCPGDTFRLLLLLLSLTYERTCIVVHMHQQRKPGERFSKVHQL